MAEAAQQQAAEHPAGLVDRVTLGLRLHMFRFERGWSLREVQERTGLTEMSLNRWERAVGKRYPDVEALAILAETYDTTLKDLLDSDATRVSLTGEGPMSDGNVTHVPFGRPGVGARSGQHKKVTRVSKRDLAPATT